VYDVADFVHFTVFCYSGQFFFDVDLGLGVSGGTCLINLTGILETEGLMQQASLEVRGGMWRREYPCGRWEGYPSHRERARPLSRKRIFPLVFW